MNRAHLRILFIETFAEKIIMTTIKFQSLIKWDQILKTCHNITYTYQLSLFYGDNPHGGSQMLILIDQFSPLFKSKQSLFAIKYKEAKKKKPKIKKPTTLKYI